MTPAERLVSRFARQPGEAASRRRAFGEYERGKVELPAQHLRTLLEIYEIDAADLIPRREPPHVDMVRRTVTVGSETRAVGDSRAAASAMLRHDQALHLFVELVRQARSAGSRAKFSVREADAAALAELLSLEKGVVVSRLMQIMGCSEREATNIWRVMSKAQSVGVAAAILATSAVTAGALAQGDSSERRPEPMPVGAVSVVEEASGATGDAGERDTDHTDHVGAPTSSESNGSSLLESELATEATSSRSTDDLADLLDDAPEEPAEVVSAQGAPAQAAVPLPEPAPTGDIEPAADLTSGGASTPEPVIASGTSIPATAIPEIAADEVVDYAPDGISGA